MHEKQLRHLAGKYKEQLTLECKMKIGKIERVQVREIPDKGSLGVYGKCVTIPNSGTYEIILNSRFFDRGIAAIKRTLVHEICHCAKTRFNHDRSFQNAYNKACMILGLQ